MAAKKQVEYHEPVYLTEQEIRVIKVALQLLRDNTLSHDSALLLDIAAMPPLIRPVSR